MIYSLEGNQIPIQLSRIEQEYLEILMREDRISRADFLAEKNPEGLDGLAHKILSDLADRNPPLTIQVLNLSEEDAKLLKEAYFGRHSTAQVFSDRDNKGRVVFQIKNRGNYN